MHSMQHDPRERMTRCKPVDAHNAGRPDVNPSMRTRGHYGMARCGHRASDPARSATNRARNFTNLDFNFERRHPYMYMMMKMCEAISETQNAVFFCNVCKHHRQPHGPHGPAHEISTSGCTRTCWQQRRYTRHTKTPASRRCT